MGFFFYQKRGGSWDELFFIVLSNLHRAPCRAVTNPKNLHQSED